jgi:hypothetical protein
MAKNKVEIDVVVDDKGTMGKVGLGAKKAGDGLDAMAKGGRNAERNTKGAAQASSNASKNFSKMSQGMGGLVGVYATFAAQMFALSAAFNFLKNAADLENLKKSQVSFAQTGGLAIKSITTQLETASKGMLGFKEAGQAAAMGVAKGFSTSQLTQLTEGALKASTALGRGYQDTFDRLLRGVSKAEPELLDELGITLRLETATQSYADAIGKSRDKLTAAERSQAVFVETMRQLNDTFGAVKAQGNPFVQLGKTFEKIAQDITAKLLPAVTSFVDLINANAKVAATAFAALALMIILNISGLIPTIKSVFSKLTGSATSTASAMAKPFKALASVAGKGIETGLHKVIDQFEVAEKALKEAAKSSATRASSGAKAMVAGGAGSKTLSKLSSGEAVTPQALGKLKKDLKRVQKELEKTGETTSKAFAGTSVEAIKKLRTDLDKMGKTSLTTAQKIKKAFAKGVVGSINAVRYASEKTANGMKRLKSAGEKTGRGLKKVGSIAKGAFGWIGIILVLTKAVEKLAETPIAVIDGFKKFLSSTIKMFQTVLNFIMGGLNKLLDNALVRKVLGTKEGEDVISKFTFADDIDNKLDALEGAVLTRLGTTREELQKVDDATADRKAKEAALQAEIDRVAELKAAYTELGTEMAIIAKGIADQKDPAKKGMQIATGIGSLPLASAMEKINAETDPTTKADLQKAFDKMLASVDTSQFGSKFQEALKDPEAMKEFQKTALTYTSSMASIKEEVRDLATTFNASTTLDGAISLTEKLTNTKNAAETTAETLNITTEAAKILDDAFAKAGGLDTFKDNLVALKKEANAIKNEKSGLDQRGARTGRLSGSFAQQESLDIAALTAANTLRKASNDLEIARALSVAQMSDAEVAINDAKIEQLERMVDLNAVQLTQAEENANQIKQLGKGIGTSLESNLQGAFQSLVDGTKSAKQAFADMAKAIIADIARMIIKMMVFNMLQSAFGGTGFGNFLGIKAPGARDGGIFSNGAKVSGYATGGVARGSTSGYPAVLHGTEAVVPLPNGKSIPVEMKDSGATNNNIVVNVSADGASQKKEGSTGPDMDKLGGAIAQAVQAELQNQKRSGGILNPYGVA